MNLNLLKSNLKTLILTIIIFVILGFLVFLINKLLFKEYVVLVNLFILLVTLIKP